MDSAPHLQVRGFESNDNLMYASQRFAQQLGADAIKEQNSYMDDGFNATAEMTTLFLRSTKLSEQHNFDKIINTYLTFAHSSNLVARDVVNGFKHSIIASMKITDTTGICTQLEYGVPGDEGLNDIQFRKENVYGDYSEWEKILEVLSFDEDAVREFVLTADSNFGDSIPTIKFVLTKLEDVGVHTISMTDKLKIYLLTNIKNLSSLVAIKAFLSEVMPATFDSADAASNFTAAMADSPRFEESQFTHDIVWFMTELIVTEDFCVKCMHFMDTKESMLQWSLREGTKQHATSGRVRLRYRVGAQQTDASIASGIGMVGSGDEIDGGDGYTHQQKTYTTASASNISQMQEDSLQGWTLRARIPPAVLHKSKLFGYVLMSQMPFADPTLAIRKHFVHDADISEKMLAQRIFKPQASVIIEFLRLLTIRVTSFDELLAFRSECFTDFSYTDSKDLSWLRFLQLYIACYRNEDVWPHVWKAFCGVLSHQVLIAVSNFKKKHTYAVDKVADICMQDDESSLQIVYDIT